MVSNGFHVELPARTIDRSTSKKEHELMAKLMISITAAKNDTGKATVGFVMANASVASGLKRLCFLARKACTCFRS